MSNDKGGFGAPSHRAVTILERTDSIFSSDSFGTVPTDSSGKNLVSKGRDPDVSPPAAGPSSGVSSVASRTGGCD